MTQATLERRQGGEPWLWTRDRYYRAAECGVFDPDEKLELLEGVVYRKHTGEPWLWTRKKYYLALENGLFESEEHRLELLEGRVVYKMPQSRPHALAIIRSSKVIERAFGEGFTVQAQFPMQLNNFTEPEPDLLVLPGTPEDYEEHPTAADAALLVEVSVSSLREDRGPKASLYARAGVKDYWTLNIIDRCLEVRRDPAVRADGTFEYRQTIILNEDETVTPLVAPNAPIRIADLLPPLRK